MLVISATKLSPVDKVYGNISMVSTQNYYLVIFVESQGCIGLLTINIDINNIEHCQETLCKP